MARQPIVDERLREREFGLWDRLTTAGVRAEIPEQAEQRAFLGKFYHRPPGGESWADVILRLRGALDTISLHHADRRVLIVCHQVVVLCLRYILEELDEAQILAIDKEGDVVNCGLCEYAFEPDDARPACRSWSLQFRGAVDRRRRRRSPPRPTRWWRRDERAGALDRELLRLLPAARLSEDGDKEDRGRLLVIAGSRELPAPPCSPASPGFAPAPASSRSRPRRASRRLAIAVPEARVIGCEETEEGCLRRPTVARRSIARKARRP